MGTSTETTAATVERWRSRGRTTISIESNDDGEWRASQRGVDVVGRGETAALAAAAYCLRVEAGDE